MKLRVFCVVVGFCSLVLVIAAQNPRLFRISGIALSNSDVTLSPTSLTWGTVIIGTTSPAKAVTLTNEGAAVLYISSIRITGTNAVDFVQTHTCGSSLTAGGQCSISVKFRPTASGARTAALTVYDNTLAGRQDVSLSGTGAAGQCVLPGRPCSPAGPRCCYGFVCRFSGGSTRVGYACLAP